MALKAVIDSLEGLPADVAKEYKQSTEGATAGKYVLDVEAVQGLRLENVDGLKNTVQTLRTEANNLKNALKGFDGLDPAKAREALDQVSKWDGLPPDKKAEQLLSAKQQQLEAAFKTKEAAIIADRDAALNQLDKNLRIAALTRILSGRKPVDGSLDMLLGHALPQTNMKKLDNGDFAVVVIDPQTKSERISPTGSSTELMTLEQLGDELVTKYPFAFAGSGATGSGATGGASGTPGAAAPRGVGGPVKTISRRDQDAMNRNLEAIAAGKVQVVD